MKKSTTASADCYTRSPDFAALLAGVHFPPEVWAVFAQCDAPRSPAEIARRAKLEPAVVASALRRLSRRRLVQKQQLDWQAYLASTGAPAAEPAAEVAPAPVAAPLAAIAPSSPIIPAPAVIAPAPAPTSVAPAPLLAFTVANPVFDLARRHVARSTLAFTLGPTPTRPNKPILAA